MRRLFLLPVLFWLTIIWVPKISEAITITIEGQNKSCPSNSCPIAGTYGSFTIENSGGIAQVVAIDGATVDRVTLTNALIRNRVTSADTLDILFLENFFSEGRAPGSYPSAVAANGTFQGVFQGDSLTVSGFSFGELIKAGNETPPSFPPVQPTNAGNATFSRSTTDNTECGFDSDGGSCFTGELRSVVALTLRGGDRLRLPSSVDVLRAEEEGPAGEAAIAEELANLAVPEPATLLLVGLGVTGLVIVKRRRPGKRE